MICRRKIVGNIVCIDNYTVGCVTTFTNKQITLQNNFIKIKIPNLSVTLQDYMI